MLLFVEPFHDNNMSTLKETYFTPSSITSVSQRMLDSLADYTRRHPLPSTLEHSALLVLDMQAYFLDAASHAFIPSALAVLPRVNALISAYARRGLPVFLSRHINTPQNAGRMADWWQDLIRQDSPLSGFAPGLDHRSGTSFSKSRYDAFIDSPLEEFLRENNITQLVICGVMTHLCCETTARSAFMRGYEVLFTVDGTATYNQALHHASLLNLAHGFAIPLLVQDVIAILEGSHG